MSTYVFRGKRFCHFLIINRQQLKLFHSQLGIGQFHNRSNKCAKFNSNRRESRIFWTFFW